VAALHRVSLPLVNEMEKKSVFEITGKSLVEVFFTKNVAAW